MPNSPAADIASYLIGLNIGTTSLSGTLPLIRVGMEPDIENRILLTVYDIPSVGSNPRYQRDEPRIQIRVKAKDEYGYEDAYAAQQAVKDSILGMNHVEIGGTRYVGVWQTSDISTLASDNKNRTILVASYRMVREYDSSLRKPIE
ncbi:hypothetical protein M316_0127 [Nitrincola phage 1M3-16]|uniref:hypothetical protein n=1 Tax=Nitrincola phage 1M3-16 TaxID=1472912 RepID=UPI000444D18F|nr:hypothetical protein GJ22_gp025 [Nitrincola phage 1M3-16]AHX01192.1 hypothetical protein M316_0127 [Nitrincola phage 1M3-16]